MRLIFKRWKASARFSFFQSPKNDSRIKQIEWPSAMREMNIRRFSVDALTAAARSKPWGESLIRRYRANIAPVSHISG
ncbi:hypothetical protein EMIT0324P_220003 [Pseudomonas chlororaphis]